MDDSVELSESLCCHRHTKNLPFCLHDGLKLLEVSEFGVKYSALFLRSKPVVRQLDYNVELGDWKVIDKKMNTEDLEM